MDILLESTGNVEAFEEVPSEPDYQIQPYYEKVIYEDDQEEEQLEEEVSEADQEEEQLEEEVSEADQKKEQLEEEVLEVDQEEEVNVIKGVTYNVIKTESVVSVNNIMDTPLNEYSIEQSLLLYIFLALLIAGFIVVVRGSILKWS